MSTIEQLEENYCLAANALADYRSANGFNPGARVIAKCRDQPEKHGVVASYGVAWIRSGLEIPIQFEDGIYPWALSNLRLD